MDSAFAALSTFAALAAMLLCSGPGRSGYRRRRQGGLPHLRRTRAAIPGGHPGATTADGHQAGSGEEQGNAGTIQGSTQ